MSNELMRLESSSIEPESLMDKRVVLYYDKRIELFYVLDVGDRKMQVRQVASCEPVVELTEAEWKKIRHAQPEWIDLDAMVGVTRFQVFKRARSDQSKELD